MDRDFTKWPFFGVRHMCKYLNNSFGYVFIEYLWRSLRYENIYFNNYESGAEAMIGIGEWINFYNEIRPHSALRGSTPVQKYYAKREEVA